MYELYIANKNYSSWSLRPWILMRALSLSFEEKLQVFEEGSNWSRFRTFSPSGRVPCLHDGSTVVWDSLAIVEYLAERHPGVWPEDFEDRTWARCAVSEMHSGFGELRNRCPMNCGLRVKLDRISGALRLDLNRMDEIWTEGLGKFGGPYLCGVDFTAADAFFAPVVFRIQTFDLPMSSTSMAYVDLMLQHTAMQEWYQAALQEPWRETSHETEIAETGTVQLDYRNS